MGEYMKRSEYISRDYLLAEYDRQHQGPPGGARKIIAEAPAADVVEVVRCRDCILARKPDRRKPAENRACEGTLICCVGFDHVYPDTDDGLIFIDENFYCAEGKRKDGGQHDE